MIYASTANIEEVMEFYNLGNKTFEADFSTYKYGRQASRFNGKHVPLSPTSDGLHNKVIYFLLGSLRSIFSD